MRGATPRGPRERLSTIRGLPHPLQAPPQLDSSLRYGWSDEDPAVSARHPLAGHLTAGCGVRHVHRAEPAEARSDKERLTTPDVPEAQLTELAAGNTTFALDLYQAIRETDGNLFFSPHSISTALAMTYAGARGETEREMAETLHYTLPQAELHAAFNALDLELAQRAEVNDEFPGQPFQLDIANSVWGQRDFTFLEAYLDTLAQHQRGCDENQ